MKQLLSLALALLPCLAWAQYPSNGNQKITLGEQTTADGLIWRGVAADTTKTVKTDTSAWIVLDTANSIMYHYDSSSVGRKWLRLNLLPSDTLSLAYVNTYGTQTVNGAKTFSSTVTGSRFNPTSSSASGNGMFLPTTNTLGFSTNGTNKMTLDSSGNLGIGLTTPNGKLHLYDGNAGGSATAYFDANDAGGGFSAYSSTFSFAPNLADRFAVFSNGNTASGLDFRADGVNSDMRFYMGGYEPQYERIRIISSGKVGIGTTSPLALLNVMGTVRINSASAPDANYYLQLENSSSQKAKANAWDTYSDSRIKTNRQPIINAIDKINLLNPTYYNQHDSYVENDLLNIDYNNSYKSLGFIAQEVYEVIPEAVNMGTTNELWAMDYTKLIPILTKAIQEQQAIIKALEQRIINLENK